MAREERGGRAGGEKEAGNRSSPPTARVLGSAGAMQGGEREALIAAGWVPRPRGRHKQWEDALHEADHVAQAAVRSPPPATE